MSDAALAWRVEQACAAAWPALEERRIGDWIARAGAGVTRRINSANPASAEAGPPHAELGMIEGAYRQWGLDPLFRLPSFLDRRVDRFLDRAGYACEGETITLHAAMDDVAAAPDAATTIQPAPSSYWLRAKAAFSGFSAARQDSFAGALSRLARPVGFAALRQGGRLVSLGYGAIDGDLLCLEAVVTDEVERGRGYARRMLGSLLDWARSRGAAGVCLQVEAGNAPAISLYAGMGVRTELYRYHYRRKARG